MFDFVNCNDKSFVEIYAPIPLSLSSACPTMDKRTKTFSFKDVKNSYTEKINPLSANDVHVRHDTVAQLHGKIN